MDNSFQNFKGEHPPQEKFLLYVDGELASKESARWQSHLEACWSCRVRVGKIEETIADIIEFEDTVSRFQASRPSQNWGNFDSRLEKLAQETRKKSIKSRLFDFWKQIEQFRSFNQAGKLASVGLALLLVFAIVYQFVFVPPVSAGELLEKTAAAQQEKLKGTNQPVVYQKLKITEQEKSAVLEVWNEVATAKNKKFPVVNGNEEDTGVLDEYEAAMTRNGFDALKPLSSEIYQLWRNRSTDKNERISQTKLADGANGFELTTIIGEPREIGEITQASLIVRQTDWHIISQSIQIKTESGDKTFEVSELEFHVLNRDTLAENFFDNIPISNEIASNTKPTPNASPNVSPSPAPSAETLPETNLKTVPSPNAPFASADLEVEVLDLLSQAKADMGEQITVTRENGLLSVRGIVETPQRKDEILSALAPVKNNPSVKIDIKTVSEAVAAEKNNPKQPTTVQEIQTENSSIAAENDLIEHFGSAEAARAFATATVARSGRAMNHAYALKRLIQQFKPEELRQLSPEARAKWLALVNSHARAFGEETEALRRELQPIFSVPNTSAAATPAVKNAADVPQAIETLFDLASANNRVVRSAMTVSAGDAQFTAIKTTQFWQSLKSAEALAAKLKTIR